MRLTTFADELTRAIGARRPRNVPAWLVKLVAPVMAQLGSTTLVLSNARIRRELGWTPRYATVDEGLRELARAAHQAS